MQRLLLCALLALAMSACSVQTSGPAAPIAREQFTSDPALDASASRQAVVDFVEAYRASPTEGVAPLANIVAGNELGAWVRWLGVQHREFDGTIEATADVRDVEFVQGLEARRASGSQVGLSASVTFTFDPVDDRPIELARVLDGPVTLVRTAAGSYRILDLYRNGVPMSDSIELFRNEVQTQGDVTVRLDSLFMFPPNWQFNLIVENGGSAGIVVDPTATTLFMMVGASFEPTEAVITPSLGALPAGAAADGLIVVPAQDDADGRVLVVTYDGGKDLLRFEFPLDGLVSVVPPLPPTDVGTAEASPN